MKVAVTGASGFIGRHVLAELRRRNIDAVAVTRDSKKLQSGHDGTHVVEMDIAQPDAACFAKMGCPDVLIHLAWGGLPNYKSLHHFESELPMQYSFLKALVEAGLPSMLVTGTCFEYGMRSGVLSEDLVPLPENPYGYAKDALRRQLSFLRLIKPFGLTWARLFYLYGDGQPETSIYPQLMKAALRGDAVFNMSGGEQLRDYFPVTEAARIIVKLAIDGGDIGVVNICSGKPVSVRGQVERWLMDNNWQIKLNLGHYAYPDYEPMAFWGDSAKLQKVLKEDL